MIFRPFASSSEATTIHSGEVNPVGLAEENGREGPKKGDFTGKWVLQLAQKSFFYLEPKMNLLPGD